jgi:hypothetical protein
VKKAYDDLFTVDAKFLKSIESDTAGAPNTSARLRIWGNTLSEISGQSFRVPKIPLMSPKKAKPKPADKEPIED